MPRKSKKKYYYTDQTHSRFMKTKEGVKIIAICRILAKEISTVDEIKSKLEAKNLPYSQSEIYKLLKIAEDFEWINSYYVTKETWGRGKPKIGNYEKKTGRPLKFYMLSHKGLSYMRVDPELTDNWKLIEEEYFNFYRKLSFDCYNNLWIDIEKHPILSKLRKRPDFNRRLGQKLLNPLLFEWSLDDEEFDKLSDELLGLIKENVLPDFIGELKSILKDAIRDLRVAIKRHKILLEKIKALEK